MTRVPTLEDENSSREFIFSESLNVSVKIKNLQIALDLILRCGSILKMMCDRNPSGAITSIELCNDRKKVDGLNESVEEEMQEREAVECVESGEKSEVAEDRGDEANEERELLELLETRFQFILKSLIKHCSASTK